MKTADALHKKWMKDPKYRAEYDALEEEFTLAPALIAARAKAGLSQKDVSGHMNCDIGNQRRPKGNGS